MTATVPYPDHVADSGPQARERRAGNGRPGFVRRIHPAIGASGLAWGALAAVLGVASIVLMLVQSHVTRHAIDIRDNRAIASDMIVASDHLDKVLIAILGMHTSTTSYSRYHPPLFEWADAAKRLKQVCGHQQRSDDLGIRIDRVCTAFFSLEPMIVPALSAPAAQEGPVDRKLVAALFELVRLAGETRMALRLELRARMQRIRDVQAETTTVMILTGGGFFLSGLILCFLIGRSAARHHAASAQATKAHAAAQRHRQQLLDAIDALPVGFALYDRDERLVLFNRRLSDMAMGELGQPDIGRPYADFIDRFGARLADLYPRRDFAGWRDDNLERFRRGNGTADQVWGDNRIVRVSETRTQDGGTVVIVTDLTALKHSEAEARASKQRFEALVDSLTDIVFSLDRESRFTYVSASMRDITGYSPEELRQHTVFELIHPDDHPLMHDVAARLRAERGVPVTFVCRMRRTDRSYRLTEIRMTARERGDSCSGDLAMTGLARDVEARHELERRLHDRMERLNSIVQSTGALFLLVDRDFRIVMANNGFLGFTGLKEEQIVGQKLGGISQAKLDRKVIEGWLGADKAAALAPIEYDDMLLNGDGERRTIRVTANPVRGTSGRVEHIVFLGVDETERRRAELQLFEAARLATLGEMASGIAHEINQPLTVIRFAAESLAEEIAELADNAPLGPSRKFIEEKCERVVAQTERASLIIGDLRGFARKPGDTPDRLEISATLNVAAQMLQEQLHLAGITLERDFAADCPAVMGHANRLQQVILNLTLNARDAILEHGDRRTGRITIRSRALDDASRVEIVVEDSGPGIPEAVLPRLFEPFFTTKPVGKGTGLGLSISYQIIRQMGGTLTAGNRAEGGARFTILLAAAPAG
jgi:PAS domain S-box-containing protein